MPKPKKLIKVDFTGVSTEGGGRLIDEGPQTLEVEDVEQKEGEESGKPYLELTFKVTDGDFEGTKAWDNMSLQPQALWKLRGFMEAAGLATEDGPMEIDPEDFLGCVVIGNIIHEEYRGKTKHRIDSYSPAEDSTPAAAPSKGPKKVTKKGGGEDDAPAWKKNQEVSFKDGKKTLTGKITAISDDGATITVKVGRDEYEMGPDDLSAG